MESHLKSTENNLAIDFYHQAASTPERTALWVDHCEYSYGDIAAKASRVADWLHKRFEGEKINIGIFASRHLEAYVGLLAAVWGGHLYVPLNPKQPGSYLHSIIQDAKLQCIIAAPDDKRVLANDNIKLCPTLLPDDIMNTANKTTPSCSAAELTPPCPIPSDALAYIMYTSGSTGKPKGVAATVANVKHYLYATQCQYQLTDSDHFSQYNDLFWDPSVFDVFSAWKAGASTYVIPEDQLLFPNHFIRQKELTIWYSIPSQITLLQRSNLLKPGLFPSLRLSLFVGEPLTKAMAKAWQAAAPNSLVENVYGPTEATVVCTGQPFSDHSDCITPERDYVALGTPYIGMSLDIYDQKTESFVEPGVIGEIVISGPQVTPGYWRAPELTARSYVELDHPEIGRRRWYRTGDEGYRTEQNCFHFIGRTDNQVQVLGKRVELDEIECHLRNVSGAAEVAAIAWPIIDGSAQHIYGFIAGDSIDTEKIKKTLIKTLPRHMVPKRIIHLSQMPRNMNGKIDRKQLRRQLKNDKQYQYH